MEPTINTTSKTILVAEDVESNFLLLKALLSKTYRLIHALNGQEAIEMFTQYAPDLILMDGGKTQVHAAEEVLLAFGMDIPVCGMVKDDRHRTRGLLFHEQEIRIPLTSEGFKLVTRIQDEVHRFAITYHRKLRDERNLHSVLDDIKGIGPARRKSLMRTFKTIEAVREASVEELEAAPQMNRAAAEAVYIFFRDDKQGKM